MWWKIYFGITIIEILLDTFSFFVSPQIHIFTHIVVSFIFIVAIVGLYGYVFRKDILNQVFWQYFLGIYILIDILYLIYAAAPHAPLISSLSFITVNPVDNFSFVSTLIGVAIDIPLFYALYRLTKGELYEPRPKKKEKVFRWGMIQTALWGYASILTFFLFILAFFPGNDSGKKTDQTDSFYILFMFAPLLIFWLWVIFQYKQYKWNWWRSTLVANAVLYSGSIIFSVFAPQKNQSTSGFDFIAPLQLLILLVSLYVFSQINLNVKKSHPKRRFLRKLPIYSQIDLLTIFRKLCCTIWVAGFMLKKLSIIGSASYKRGFTLIELLVVLGILGILAAALLAAINPIEQLNKSQDAAMEQLAAEMSSADSRYYTANSAQPTACAALSNSSLSGGAAACITSLVNSGELKGTFSQAPNLSIMFFTTPSGQTPTDASSSTVCFQPKSHSVQANTNTRYSATGGNGTNCLATGGTSTTCYWCAQ